jgi:hypothetical protein
VSRAVTPIAVTVAKSWWSCKPTNKPLVPVLDLDQMYIPFVKVYLGEYADKYSKLQMKWECSKFLARVQRLRMHAIDKHYQDTWCSSHFEQLSLDLENKARQEKLEAVHKELLKSTRRLRTQLDFNYGHRVDWNAIERRNGVPSCYVFANFKGTTVKDNYWLLTVVRAADAFREGKISLSYQ